MKKSWGVIKSITNKNQKTHIQGRFKIGKNLISEAVPFLGSEVTWVTDYNM